MPTFTTDWFSARAEGIRASLSRLAAPPGRWPGRILEIGSWEGRSAVWFLDEYPDAEVTCVDTWAGGVEHAGTDMAAVKQRFKDNTASYGSRVKTREGRSDAVMFRLGADGEQFDAVYVDGSHETPDVLSDLVLAFHLLRPGGVLLVDDYGGGAGVQAAVDAFLTAFEGRLLLCHAGYQIHFVKKP